MREEREDETTHDAPADRDGSRVNAGVEREVLRERVQRLEKRLGEVDASDRIAENLYEFFSRTARCALKRKRARKVRTMDRRRVAGRKLIPAISRTKMAGIRKEIAR